MIWKTMFTVVRYAIEPNKSTMPPHAQEAASNAEKQSLEERIPKEEVEKSLEEEFRNLIEL